MYKEWVNDLDLEIVHTGTLIYPWLLDPNNPGNAATTGRDSINNVEQVVNNAPSSGLYAIRVRGYSIPDASQPYSLIITGGSPTNLTPTVISCDLNGIPRDGFAPGEGVYVKAYGLEGNTNYTICIQNESVADGDELVLEENPSSAVTPKLVTTEPNGSLPKTLSWEILGGAPITHDEFDISLDKQDDGLNTGKYNAASDGIDSASPVGFTAPVPELPTIALFSFSQLALTGYVLRKRA